MGATMNLVRPTNQAKPSGQYHDRWPVKRSKSALCVAASSLRMAIEEVLFGPGKFGSGFDNLIRARWECPKCKNVGVASSKSEKSLLLRVRIGHLRKSGSRCRFDQDTVKLRIIFRPPSPTLDKSI